MTVRFCICGAGRIGKIHARNISQHPQAEVRWVFDVNQSAAADLAADVSAQSATNLDSALSDENVDAILIASPTPTHFEIIQKAVSAKKAIFCEKPIDLNLEQVHKVVELVKQTSTPFFVGFNRRFDPSFARLKELVSEGAIGKIEQIVVTSRDPSPPPASYIASSGGIFADMTIHDFDMVRWLLAEEIVEVSAHASQLVSEEIRQMGDFDSTVVNLRGVSGALCTILNSRRAVYGYDQRVEVFGSKGMLRAENQTENTITQYNETGIVADKIPLFFLERYAQAYKREIDSFIASLGDVNLADNIPGTIDGLNALLLAQAARSSVELKDIIRVNV